MREWGRGSNMPLEPAEGRGLTWTLLLDWSSIGVLTRKYVRAGRTAGLLRSPRFWALPFSALSSSAASLELKLEGSGAY